MEFLNEIPLIGGPLAFILPFLIVLGIVVFVHEYGHYIVGKWCGIHAEVFSIGFGPKLVGWTAKSGTHWQIAALPLGGFVKFAGDMDPASAGKLDDAEMTPEERAHAFHNAALWRRAATVFAGPLFNFILSIVIFAGLALGVGRPSEEPVIDSIHPEFVQTVAFEPGDRVVAMAGEPIETFGDITTAFIRASGQEVTAEVIRGGERIELPVRYRLSAVAEAVTPGMPASRAGMVPGDVILSVDGTPVASFHDLQVATADKPLDRPIVFEVLRDGETVELSIQPEAMERPHPVTGEVKPLPTIGVRAVGLGGVRPAFEDTTVGEALETGVIRTAGIITGTLNYVGDILFANADTSQLGGPIRIAQISNERAEAGFTAFLFLIAVISTSIGFINLMPIPVLDGGHLMFYLVELVRGRPAGDTAIRYGTMIGLSLVLLLMVFATYNDLVRL